MRSRGVKLITCWLCMYALGVGAFRWCYGNDLRQHLLEREKKLGSWTFDWHMTVCETPQSNNAPLPSEDPLLPPHQGRQYAGTMTIARRGHLTYVQQVKPAHGLPSCHASCETHNFSRDDELWLFAKTRICSSTSWTHATVAEIWKTKGASVRCWASPPVKLGESCRSYLSSLAGFSPAEAVWRRLCRYRKQERGDAHAIYTGPCKWKERGCNCRCASWLLPGANEASIWGNGESISCSTMARIDVYGSPQRLTRKPYALFSRRQAGGF